MESDSFHEGSEMSGISTRILPLVAATAFVACGGGGRDARPAAADSTAAPAAGVAAAAGSTDSIGRVVYATCTACHQATGLGMPGAFPPLAGSSIVSGAPEIPIAIVLHGMTGPITVSGAQYNGVMTAWGPMFDDTQIAAVLTYVRSQFGNNAPAVTAEQVAKVRAATASRTTPWTWTELQQFKF